MSNYQVTLRTVDPVTGEEGQTGEQIVSEPGKVIHVARLIAARRVLELTGGTIKLVYCSVTTPLGNLVFKWKRGFTEKPVDV